MRAGAAKIVLLIAACVSLAGCEPTLADDGVTQLCKEAALRQPNSDANPGKVCSCSARKLQDLLSDDHYQLLEAYSALLVDIAVKNPNLRGGESHDRTLATLADQRGETVSAVNKALSAGGPLRFVRLAEQICRD